MKDIEMLSPEDALALQSVWEAIQGIDLQELEKEKEARKTDVQKLLDNVKLGKALERKFGQKKKIGRPKLHWKTKAKRRRETKSRYYQNTWKPRRQAELVEELTTWQGWYKHITKYWKGEMMGPRQWKEHLWPRLNGKVPVFKRDDTKKGWTLDNVVMYESGTRNILWCPEDLALAKLNEEHC